MNTYKFLNISARQDVTTDPTVPDEDDKLSNVTISIYGGTAAARNDKPATDGVRWDIGDKRDNGPGASVKVHAELPRRVAGLVRVDEYGAPIIVELDDGTKSYVLVPIAHKAAKLARRDNRAAGPIVLPRNGSTVDATFRPQWTESHGATALRLNLDYPRPGSGPDAVDVSFD